MPSRDRRNRQTKLTQQRPGRFRGGSDKNWVSGHARVRLGQRLLRTQEYAEAEAMLTAGLREMIDEYPHIRDYSLNAIPEGHRSLLDLYQVTNRPENARNWLGETLETMDTLVKNLAQGKFTPNLVTLVEMQVLHHIAAGRHDDAVAIYREVNTSHSPANNAIASESVCPTWQVSSMRLPKICSPWTKPSRDSPKVIRSRPSS